MRPVFAKSEKGQAAAEFGVILPAMIILILAVIVYGRPYYLKLAAQNIAYSGCVASTRSSIRDPYASLDAMDSSESFSNGVGEVVTEMSFGWGGNTYILSNAWCRSLVTSKDAYNYNAFHNNGELDGFIKGVAVFYPANFMSAEYGK